MATSQPGESWAWTQLRDDIRGDLEDELFRRRRRSKRTRAGRQDRCSSFVLREKPLDPQDLRLRRARSRPRQDQRGPRHQEGHHRRPDEGQAQRREDQGPLRREGLLPRRGRAPRSSARTRTKSTSTSTIDEHAKVEVRYDQVPRQRAASPTPSSRRDGHAGGRLALVPHVVGHLSRRRLRSRPIVLYRVLLRPRLYQREAR